MLNADAVRIRRDGTPIYPKKKVVVEEMDEVDPTPQALSPQS